MKTSAVTKKGEPILVNSLLREIVFIAVDGSHTAQNAAKLGIQIAMLNHWMVYGLYIVDSHQAAYSIPKDPSIGDKGKLRDFQSGVVITMEEEGNHALNLLRKECMQEGIPIVTEMVFGSVSDLIIQKSTQSSLLVIGRNGNKQVQGPGYLGQNSRAILRAGKKPLLIGSGQLGSINRILLASSDLSSLNRSKASIPWIKGSLPKGSIHPESGKTQGKANPVASGVMDQGLPPFDVVQINEQRPSKILAKANGMDADLIILAGYPHQVSYDDNNENNIEYIIGNIQKPVIVT